MSVSKYYDPVAIYIFCFVLFFFFRDSSQYFFWYDGSFRVETMLNKMLCYGIDPDFFGAILMGKSKQLVLFAKKTFSK